MAELGLVVSLPLPPQHSGVPGFRFILNSWGNPCADGPCDEAAGLDDGTWSQSLVVPACPLWERAVTSRHRPVHRDLHTLSVSEGKGSWRGHPATLGSLPFLPVAWQENPSRPSRKCPVCLGGNYGQGLMLCLRVSVSVSVPGMDGGLWCPLHSEVQGMCVPHLVLRTRSMSQARSLI